MMKIADSLKLFGSFGHAAPENGGTSHAVCLEKMKLPTGPGSLHFLCAPLPKMAGRLRQLACPRYAHAENCRQSQALRTRGHENGGTSQAVCTPMTKIADSLKLFAFFGHATPENGGTSRQVCMGMMKTPTVSGFEHPRSRKARHVSGGLHAHDTPMLKIADSLRL